jgi:hypothetical protein
MKTRWTGLVVVGIMGAFAAAPGAVVAQPCIVPDNGTGTVTMPPANCPYVSPTDFHVIVDGLPAGTTIVVGVQHEGFYCPPTQGICTFPPTPPPESRCNKQGGPLGGEMECSGSQLQLTMNGTGTLAGFTRNIPLGAMFETHIGPRVLGDPVQSFDTDMFVLQGQLPIGDPDFDLLRITAGSGFGLPSPGHTTLTRQGPPGSNWAVDSFFDIEYRIDFIGHPGSVLGGHSGSTTGTIRMQAGGPIGGVCEPNTTQTACNPTTCPSLTEECLAHCGKLNPFTGQVTVNSCDCRQLNECHLTIPQIPAVVAGVGGNPCVVVGNGGGSVDLPPVGCEYLSPDEVHKIINGLPAGTEIHLAPIHKDFICHEQGTINPVCSFQTLVDCKEAGGTLGGEKECAESELQLDLSVVNPPCPGPLCGWTRSVQVPMAFETHTAPRTPGDPVQSFDTDMFRMFGQINNIGDPDFDLLRIVGGTDFGMPSPGHTTLTKLPGGPQWAVDSFFDITYRIDFVGAPGGHLGGMSGSTTATIRMQTGAPFRCEGGCPAGFDCRDNRVVNADGTIDLCCDCEPVACQPNSAGTACNAVTCPIAGEKCEPQVVICPAGTTSCHVSTCDCQDSNLCHVDLNAVGQPICVNPCPTPGDTCDLVGTDTDGDGVPDLFHCNCHQPPPGCEPNSQGTACNPTTCPVGPLGPEKCQLKCVIVNPLTGKITLDTCDCVGPNECHMEITPAGDAGNVADGGTVAGPGLSAECMVPDNGSGTVTLPPAGCPYLSPQQVHMIIDGLPVPTTIELATIHKDFICNRQSPATVCSFQTLVDCDEPGGSLGGEKECSDSTLKLSMQGTDTLAGFSKTINLPVSFETHTAPRIPGQPVQSFDTDMFRLFGQITGDPDFDLLRITAGTDFGMPSPGHTTLTRTGTNWAVDSFFDITYRIDFVGHSPGPLGGHSGSTTGTIRMQSTPFRCSNDCPPGMVCKETRTQQADGTLKVCCECQPAPTVCEPLPDHSGCTNAACDCFGECIHGAYCDNPACCIDPNNCVCYEKNTQESIKRCPRPEGCFGQCQGGSYCDDPARPDCCIAGFGACACYAPNHHYSIYLCGDCFGQCVNGSYCDSSNPNCCLDPGNCQCYSPTDPISIKMCTGKDECKPTCVKYNQLTGQVTVEQCACAGNDCFVKVGPTLNTAGPGGPCEVVDNGSGSVDLPPAGCEYLSPTEVHKIIDGLPAGTEIHLAPIHKDFICHKGQPGVCSFLDVDCKEDGGSLGGEKECSNSTREFQLTGTGTLAGWNRIVTIPNVSFETHTGVKKPGQPVQEFPTDMFRLFGEISNIGDPDFDLLRIVAGTDFGLPSPGHTTLTQLPNGKWAVDSFFDIEYRIDFVGSNAAGSRLGGRSGSTTATIRMATNTPFKCSNSCPPGKVCKQTTTLFGSCSNNPAQSCTTNADCGAAGTCVPNGTMDVCCDCVDAPPACQPKADGLSCTNNTCPNASERCSPKRIQCLPGVGCRIVECDCDTLDECHVVMPPTGAIQPVCQGSCPVPSNDHCNLQSVPLPGGGTDYSCSCANVIVWDPATNPVPWPNNNSLATTRSLAFKVTGPATPGKVDAIKVCMVDLQNPVPPNAPPFPPQNFSAYETATCTAAGEQNGCCRWVGPWVTVYESQGPPLAGPSIAARLQCTPYYWDWKSKGPIWVVGAEIMPSSQYSVQAYGDSCMGNEGTCTNVSAPVTMYTRRSGDVEAVYNPPTNVPQPDAIDLAQVVNKFAGKLGAPLKCRAQLQPNLPELNTDVNALDIVAVVDAIKGKAYPFSGPCPCPSKMLCRNTPCATPAVCVALPAASGGGAGAMCVKTCVGGSADGQPCINIGHCPGGTSCGAAGPTPGFCRDKCGRCNKP